MITATAITVTVAFFGWLAWCVRQDRRRARAARERDRRFVEGQQWRRQAREGDEIDQVIARIMLAELDP